MKAKALIQRAQNKHNSLGASEMIEYHHTPTGVIEPELYCFISNHEYTDAKYGIRKTEAVFSQLLLLEEPSDTDTILYEDKEYRVVRWEKQLGFYNVYAEAKRQHTGERMKHQSSGRGVR